MGVDREEGDGVYMCSATEFARTRRLTAKTRILCKFGFSCRFHEIANHNRLKLDLIRYNFRVASWILARTRPERSV